MKFLSIYIVTSASYSQRLCDIISNVGSNLLHHNFSVISRECGHLYDYQFNSEISSQWISMLPSIYQGLFDNLQLLGIPNDLTLSALKNVTSSYELPSWLRPRCLTFGDLSVISKHHQALKAFLKSTDDYLKN